MAENHVVKALVSEAPCSEDDQNLETLSTLVTVYPPVGYI